MVGYRRQPPTFNLSDAVTLLLYSLTPSGAQSGTTLRLSLHVGAARRHRPFPGFSTAPEAAFEYNTWPCRVWQVKQTVIMLMRTIVRFVHAPSTVAEFSLTDPSASALPSSSSVPFVSSYFSLSLPPCRCKSEISGFLRFILLP